MFNTDSYLNAEVDYRNSRVRKSYPVRPRRHRTQAVLRRLRPQRDGEGGTQS